MLLKTRLSALVLMFILAGLLSPAFAQRNKSAVVTDKALLEKMKQDVEANPDSLSKHTAYIGAMGLDNPALVTQYDVWMKRFPKSAVVPYGLGKAYVDVESPKAKPYLLKTVEIDPKFTEAWGGLWIDAERWGDFKLSRDYLAKAVASNPANADYSFYYASSFNNYDQDKWRDMSLAVAKKFPESERGAQALYWLGERSTSTADKLKYFELLRNSYSPAKFSWSSSGMSSYYNLLLSVDPTKALALARDMEKNSKDAKTWTNYIDLAQNVADAQKLSGEKKYGDAIAALNKVKLPRYLSFNKNLLLLIADNTDKMGNTKGAYDNLMASFVNAPTPKFMKALMAYGSKLGKSEADVKADIYKAMDANAKDATPFNLKNYFTQTNTSLADYKGSVVLLTYWFPGCGPCRGEFPHFENVVKQYKGKSFKYVGINIASDQNDYVLPFMKSSGYSFTPLEDVTGRVKGNLDNKNAAPVNFMLDQNGRILFANFRIDQENEDDLKLMIDMLLNHRA